jgi:hypothetical protein
MKNCLKEMWQTFNTNIFDLWEIEKVEIYEKALIKSSQIWTCSLLFLDIIHEIHFLFVPDNVLTHIISWILIALALIFIIISFKKDKKFILCALICC